MRTSAKAEKTKASVEACDAIQGISKNLTGKRGKTRFVPVHPKGQRLIEEYMALASHGAALDGPLFRPVKNNRTGTLDKHLDPGSIYRNIVQHYGRMTGIGAEVIGLCVHSLRATAATNALRMKRTLQRCRSGSATRMSRRHRLYDRRKSKPEESPTFHVKY